MRSHFCRDFLYQEMFSLQHEKEEVGEDGEGQIEVESERGELKEKRSCMTVNVDEMSLRT